MGREMIVGLQLQRDAALHYSTALHLLESYTRFSFFQLVGARVGH